MPFGYGDYKYEVVDNWAKRPARFTWVEVADCDVDAEDNVYVFSRSEHPVMIFDKDGNFLDWWGAGHFTNPHGITIAPDGTVWCADTRDHTVKHFTREGKLLNTLGQLWLPSPQQGGKPFNQPTHVAVASNGDIYVSDGYGNSQIHVFSPEGDHKFSWGSEGDDPGQFRLPHSVSIDKRDRVYVCDRFNSRMQLFTKDGEFITIWEDVHRPCDMVIGHDDTVYIAELDHRVSVWNQDGTKLSGWGDEQESEEAGLFIAPHGTSVDSQGSWYVGEVSEAWRRIDRGYRTIQKFVRV